MLIRTLFRPFILLFGLLMLAACGSSGGNSNGGNVDTTRAVTVALLVPTGSGDAGREEIAKSLVSAARLAQSDLSGVTINLKVYATAGDLATAAAAAQKAVDEGAEIILGPLFADATTGVAPIAAAAGIKVISFSNNPTISGGNVWVLGQTFESSAERITGFAAARGLTRIGIVHPQGIEGELARNAVQAAAPKFGATVAAVGSYSLSVQGISQAARGIATQMRNAGVNILVLTDGPTGGLPFVSETLRGLGVRANAVQFAGLQRWDISRDALSQPGIQGGWFVAPDVTLTAQFRNRYEAAYGIQPHPLAALAFDGVAAIGALVNEAQLEKRRDPFSTERLTQPAGFAGVNGVFRFLPDGRNQRSMAVFEVRDGEARVIDPAPREFVTGGL